MTRPWPFILCSDSLTALRRSADGLLRVRWPVRDRNCQRYALSSTRLFSGQGGGGRMHPTRKGQRWELDEQGMLLDELRGNDSLAQIAARHMRSPGAICSRIAKLLAPVQLFPDNETLFDWARSELCKGLTRPIEQTGAGTTTDAAAGGYSSRGGPGTSHPGAESADAWIPARIQPATTTRRLQVVDILSSLTATACRGQSAPNLSGCPELDVLAGFDDAHLEKAGAAILRLRGEITAASWVLECDWAGVEGLRLTADEIRSGNDNAQQIGEELLQAGLGRSRGRDREIMGMRLGLAGEAMTLKAIGEIFERSRERIRQIQNKVLTRASVTRDATVRRGWHHVHDTLLAALRRPGATELAPDLVLSFVELAAPLAPRDVAVDLVARLCGLKADGRRNLQRAVEEHYAERTRQRRDQLKQEKTRDKLRGKVRQMLERAEWPSAAVEPAGGDATPLRLPIGDRQRSNSGTWFSPRLGREVGYDSDEELQVIQMLEVSDDLVESYCEQPIKLSYELYGRRHDYYPDLLVNLRDGRRLLVEVKARIDHFAIYENVVKFKAAREFCNTLGWGFIATTAYIRNPDDLANREVGEGIEEMLKSHLSGGPTDWEKLHPMLSGYDNSYSDIATLVLRNGWYWHRDPFRLSATPFTAKTRWRKIT